jgi:hypothetical protein
MSWSRFDDLYDDHPKVMAATHSNALAAALHPQAITAASRRESDGLVDPFWLLARAPDKRKRTEALAVLVRLRLFDVIPAGETWAGEDDKGHRVVIGPFEEDRHIVHDYLDYNPSSAQLQERRRLDAERKASGRRKDSDGSPAGHEPDSDGSPNGPRGSAGADPRPNPIPSQSQGQHLAATPQRSRAGDTSRSMAETVACPRCRVPAGEKCDGVRSKRESAHLERHHAVGELTHITSQKPTAKPAAVKAYAPDPEIVALRDEHFPGEDVTAVTNCAATLQFRRQPVTPEGIRELLIGGEAA